jgi:hypothetical protein
VPWLSPSASRSKPATDGITIDITTVTIGVAGIEITGTMVSIEAGMSVTITDGAVTMSGAG